MSLSQCGFERGWGKKNQGNLESIKAEEMGVLLSSNGTPLIDSSLLKAINKAHSERAGL